MRLFINIIIIIVLFLSRTFFPANLLKAQNDSIYAEIIKDTVKVLNLNLFENCGSKFRTDFSFKQDTILLTETDTSHTWYKCNCNFNITASITGLSGGNYFIRVIRRYENQMSDQIKYIGMIYFKYSPSLLLKSSHNSIQSACLSNLSISEKKYLADFKFINTYPNPFNLSTVVKYEVSRPGIIRHNVYDILGRLVKSGELYHAEAGKYEYIFDAKNLSSGIYFYNLKNESGSVGKKIFLVK